MNYHFKVNSLDMQRGLVLHCITDLFLLKVPDKFCLQLIWDPSSKKHPCKKTFVLTVNGSDVHPPTTSHQRPNLFPLKDDFSSLTVKTTVNPMV